MHFGDSIFIFLLALVLFGPKKLPEIGRTIGKLLAEFRRASNEFKFQIQEELRNMEDEERRKKLAEQQAQKAAEALPAATADTPTILPPSIGTQVNASVPFATPVDPAEPTSVSAPVTPNAAEVAVEPPTPTLAGVESHSELEAPAHVDLTATSNGAHSAEPLTETPDPLSDGSPAEPLRHG